MSAISKQGRGSSPSLRLAMLSRPSQSSGAGEQPAPGAKGTRRAVSTAPPVQDGLARGTQTAECRCDRNRGAASTAPDRPSPGRDDQGSGPDHAGVLPAAAAACPGRLALCSPQRGVADRSGSAGAAAPLADPPQPAAAEPGADQGAVAAHGPIHVGAGLR